MFADGPDDAQGVHAGSWGEQGGDVREGDCDAGAADYEEDAGECGEGDGVSVGSFDEHADGGAVGRSPFGETGGEAVVGSDEKNEGGWCRGRALEEGF